MTRRFPLRSTRDFREDDDASVTAAKDAALERIGSGSTMEDEEFLEHGRRHMLKLTADDEW
ncbi:hypothetical protein C5B96_04420 [Subtercola sp. Z020]|uniref:hypothetical protein n=1 Tax=Subtercola sp. Z020 TaxID=2080582 RepID=UPI000CE8DE71|nr:hypothetical protein [Subtercola sp. Z020]PPF87280.1 hypothetical protein C5B96_04420 [Subtercola sp. Z020]